MAKYRAQSGCPVIRDKERSAIFKSLSIFDNNSSTSFVHTSLRSFNPLDEPSLNMVEIVIAENYLFDYELLPSQSCDTHQVEHA